MNSVLIVLILALSGHAYAVTDLQKRTEKCASDAEYYVQKELQRRGMASDLSRAATVRVRIYESTSGVRCGDELVVHTLSGVFNIVCEDRDGTGCACEPKLHRYIPEKDSAGCY